MNSFIKPIVFALWTGLLGSAALAQTTDETDTQTPTDLSLGEVVGPQIGDRYVAQTSGDWNIRCLKTEDGNDPCQLQQQLIDQDGNLVAEITMNPLSGDGPVVAGANLITPLETMLTEQVTIQVDEGQAKRYPFAFCSTVGCISRIGLTADELASYKAGANARIVIVPFAAPDKPVVLVVSLTGFTAAFDTLAK